MPASSNPAGSGAAGSVPLRYHWLRLRAACHPTEDLSRVQAAVQFVAGTATVPTVTGLESYHGGELRLVEATLDRSRDVRNVLQRLLDLPGARADLAQTLDARTDDDGVFYARFDKQAAAQQRLAMTRGEDAVQLRLKMEHYPATREAALQALSVLVAAERP